MKVLSSPTELDVSRMCDRFEVIIWEKVFTPCVLLRYITDSLKLFRSYNSQSCIYKSHWSKSLQTAKTMLNNESNKDVGKKKKKRKNCKPRF